MDGLVVIDKPARITSHDVVNRIRRILRVRRVGHGGTLDPAATGVLVVLVGLATRLAEYLLEGDKTYRFRVRFGVETATYDLDGAILREEVAAHATRKAVEAVSVEFLGEKEMLPPMASAVRQNGQRLYTWARRGLELQRAPRRVRIYELRLLDFTPSSPHPEAEFVVRCSKGTYVRSLAMEIGRALGTVGTVVALRREASSGFTLDSAVSLDTLEEAAKAGAAGSYLQPTDEAVKFLPQVMLSEEPEGLFCRGHSSPLQGTQSSEGPCTCRVYGSRGFLGIGIMVPGEPEGARVIPKKVLWRPDRMQEGIG